MPFILQAPKRPRWSGVALMSGESYTNQTSKSSKPTSRIAGRFH